MLTHYAHRRYAIPVKIPRQCWYVLSAMLNSIFPPLYIYLYLNPYMHIFSCVFVYVNVSKWYGIVPVCVLRHTFDCYRYHETAEFTQMRCHFDIKWTRSLSSYRLLTSFAAIPPHVTHTYTTQSHAQFQSRVFPLRIRNVLWMMGCTLEVVVRSGFMETNTPVWCSIGVFFLREWVKNTLTRSRHYCTNSMLCCYCWPAVRLCVPGSPLSTNRKNCWPFVQILNVGNHWVTVCQQHIVATQYCNSAQFPVQVPRWKHLANFHVATGCSSWPWKKYWRSGGLT